MQIDYLRCFIALNDFNSITKASHVLDTTPQNVSRILKKLETEMNALLFTRSSDGITLTPYGERFLQFAKSTVYQYDELQADFQFRQSQHAAKQEVVLYSSDVTNEIILNDILLAFSKDYPSIVVKNITVDWIDGYQNLQEEGSAIALLHYLPGVNDLDNHIIVPTLRFHPIVAVNKNHPLATVQHCTYKQLLNYNLLIFAHNDLINTLPFHALGLDPVTQGKNFATTGSMKACYQMVAEGNYISLGALESFMLFSESIRENLVPIPIIDLPEIICALIKSKSLPADSPQQLLFSYILNSLQKYEAQHQ